MGKVLYQMSWSSAESITASCGFPAHSHPRCGLLPLPHIRLDGSLQFLFGDRLK
jgi:predicted YcjX-like family ATPase